MHLILREVKSPEIANRKRVIKLCDLTPVRDFNYVEDTCRGLIAIGKCEKAIGEVVNIGSNHEIAIGDLLKLIKEMMRFDVDVETDPDRIRPKKSEVYRLWCDNTKINELTGFIS